MPITRPGDDIRAYQISRAYALRLAWEPWRASISMSRLR